MNLRGYEMIRYADDAVILCSTEEEAKKALTEMKAWMEARELTLHPEKTRIVDATVKGGFDFLGYHFERNTRWPRNKSMKKLKDSLRQKTKRTSGESMKCIIDNLNRSLKGWFEYFRHSNRKTFQMTDKWIRMRLRSILRKRQGRQPMLRLVNPDEETTDWRAVCGKSACTVRGEGRRKPFLPPISEEIVPRGTL